MDLQSLLAKMSKQFKTHLTEDNVIDEVKVLIEAAGTKAATLITEKDKTIKDQGTKIKGLEQKVGDLQPLATEGKAYREEMVDKYVEAKAKLGDISEKEEDHKSVKEVVKKYPIDHLKSELKILEKRVEEKFPAGNQLEGDTRRDRTGDIGDDDDSKWEKADKNPLIPKEAGKK